MSKPKTFTFLGFLAIILFITVFVIVLFKADNKWLVSLVEGRVKTSSSRYNYVNIPNVTVNLPGRADHFCKAGFTLAVAKKGSKLFKSNKNYIQVVKASIIALMSSYSYDSLSTREGKLRLKNHIKATINKNLAPDLVQEVYFRELIFQQ